MNISTWEEYRCEGFGGVVFVGVFVWLVGFWVIFVFLLLKDEELLVHRFHIQADMHKKHVQCISVFIGLCFHFLNFFLADIAQRYRISKYPTLKLFRNGMMMKREYRGQRSVTAIADYIRQQKSNPIREVQDLEEISSLDVSVSILFLLRIFFSVELWSVQYLVFLIN